MNVGNDTRCLLARSLDDAPSSRLRDRAGPNGAGKSTAALALLRDLLGVGEYVNADLIAQGLSAFDTESVAFQAGRVMLARLKQLAAKRRSFAFETTLATRSYLPWLSSLQGTRLCRGRGVFVATEPGDGRGASYGAGASGWAWRAGGRHPPALSAVASRTSSGCIGPLRTDGGSSTIRAPPAHGWSLVARARRPTSRTPRSGQL